MPGKEPVNRHHGKRLPGFAAEASLYDTDERYQKAKVFDAQASRTEVRPQGFGCFLNCIAWGNDPVDCARGCGIKL